MAPFEREISSSGDTNRQGQYPDADGQWNKAPIFNFNDGKVKFNTNWVSNANENYGSTSGFLPKSLLDNEIVVPPITSGAFTLI